MNALRHGLAAKFGNQDAMSEASLDLEALSERISRIETESGKLTERRSSRCMVH